MTRKTIVPNRLGINTPIRFWENNSLIRKYSEKMRRSRNTVKTKNFFIDDSNKERLHQQPFPCIS